MDRLKQWVTGRVSKLLGYEDDGAMVKSKYVYSFFSFFSF
jgi:hypothetical protein